MHKTIIVDGIDKIPSGWRRICDVAKEVAVKYNKKVSAVVYSRLAHGAAAGQFAAYKIAKTRGAARANGPVFVAPETASEVLKNVLQSYYPPTPVTVEAPPPAAAEVYAINADTGRLQAEAAPPLLADDGRRQVAAAFAAMMNRLERLENQLRLQQAAPATVQVTVSPEDLAAALDLVVEVAARRTQAPALAARLPALVYNGVK